MRTYTLNIANYRIRFEKTSGELDLIPSERFSRFISRTDTVYDVCIRVFSGDRGLPPDAVKVFSAPYVEEISGIRIKKNERFWSVYKKEDELYILTDFPFSSDNRSGTLRFSPENNNWDLYLSGTGNTVDPMDYPLDGLILYYLTVIHGDIMIHASGVSYKGKGYIFSGISGKGKTTMAGLWDSHGARIIHDDRLIIRRKGSCYMMYNTPVYRNDQPRKSYIDSIFLIDHGNENKILPVKGAAAITSLISNCIQHNWSDFIIKRMLDSVVKVCTSVPVYYLWFRPDAKIIEYILQHENEK